MRTRLLAVAIAVIGAIAITLPVLTLAGDIFDGGESGDGWKRTPRAANDPPRIGNQLAVCVEAVDVDPDSIQVAKMAVESTLREIEKADPGWFNNAFPQRTVDIGCPYPPAVGERFGNGRVVFAGSYYHTFVFVLSADRLSAILHPGDLFGRLGSTVYVTAEEVICGGDACAQETYGIYLTPEDLVDPNRYLYDMYWALYAGHLAEIDGPPDPFREPVEAQLPPNN